MQSLYEGWEKRRFVKAAVGKAVPLRECPLGEFVKTLLTIFLVI